MFLWKNPIYKVGVIGLHNTHILFIQIGRLKIHPIVVLSLKEIQVVMALVKFSSFQSSKLAYVEGKWRIDYEEQTI